MQNFIDTNKIEMDVAHTPENRHMPEFEGNHYLCTLRHAGREMVVPFSQGKGISGEPEIRAVLECIQLDSYSLQENFYDWCMNFGYSDDSIRAEKIYKACEDQAAELTELLGAELFEQFLTVEV